MVQSSPESQSRGGKISPCERTQSFLQLRPKLLSIFTSIPNRCIFRHVDSQHLALSLLNSLSVSAADARSTKPVTVRKNLSLVLFEGPGYWTVLSSHRMFLGCIFCSLPLRDAKFHKCQNQTGKRKIKHLQFLLSF